MFKIWMMTIVFAARECWSQDEDGPYRGKHIGKLNTYHHQVSGDVYAVDDFTILLVDFNYDGTGEDTFFWAGDAGRPGPQGFIVPDEHGKTNILERYHDAEMRLALPDGKRVSRLKWFAVYDIGSQNAFGDAFVPDEFSAPAPALVGALAGDGADSRPVHVLDANTLLLPELRYAGGNDAVYFRAGAGAVPGRAGKRIPDERGYLEPLRAYRGEDVRLRLPGALTVFDVDWLALYDEREGAALAAVLLPSDLNVPPAATRLHAYRPTLPDCRQLHRDYQVAWEVFGNQITIELAGQIAEDEYLAFGISGAADSSRMLGADVAVTYYSPTLRRGVALDYNVSATAACVQVLGAWRGVCRDTLLGGLDSNQVLRAEREEGVTRVSYRRTLKPEDAMDLEWDTAQTRVVWAVGRLDAAGEPQFHRLFPRADVTLRLASDAARAEDRSDCFPFSVSAPWLGSPWETAQLFDPALRVFRFMLGPSGGARGLAARGGGAPLAWYVNGQLAPDLQLRRGLSYTLRVWGGNDPHSASEYHPLVLTAEPRGGLERLPDAEQRLQRPLAGALAPRRGRQRPAAAGALCIARRAPGADPRRDDDFASFRAFNRSLVWECAEGAPADLTVTPNASWPDLVYYNSFTHAGMGGRIFVVDRHKRNIGRGASSPLAPSRSHAAALLTLLLLLRRH